MWFLFAAIFLITSSLSPRLYFSFSFSTFDTIHTSSSVWSFPSEHLLLFTSDQSWMRLLSLWTQGRSLSPQHGWSPPPVCHDTCFLPEPLDSIPSNKPFHKAFSFLNFEEVRQPRNIPAQPHGSRKQRSECPAAKSHNGFPGMSGPERNKGCSGRWTWARWRLEALSGHQCYTSKAQEQGLHQHLARVRYVPNNRPS